MSIDRNRPNRITAIEVLMPNGGWWEIGEKFFCDEGLTLPTEEAIQAKTTELQADYDSKQYQRERAESYPELKEQLDLLWHAIDGGKFNVKSKETDFYKKLKAVKDANPKPE